MRVDVAIIGAGPAGASAGLVLGDQARTLLVDRRAEPEPRIGESLVPAARRLFRDLSLLQAFEAEGHPAYLGNRSFWNGAEAETDFLRDPDGPGWHLDRPRFERFLRRAAGARGCRIAAPAKLETLDRQGELWRLGLADGMRRIEVICRVVIDATGRPATVAKRLGAIRRQEDALVARWIRGRVHHETSETAGFSLVASEPDGWWYTAPLIGGTRILAFHGDRDLIDDTGTETACGLLARARRCPSLGETLARAGFMIDGGTQVATAAANGARTDPVAGSGWLATGDAAISFDPLSSRGLFNALYTGVSGAMTALSMLSGAPGAEIHHAAVVDRVAAAYRRHHALVYGSETRWPDAPFWHRRASDSGTGVTARKTAEA